MSSLVLPGGARTLGDLTVSRFGYGAMQLAGPWVWPSHWPGCCSDHRTSC